MSGVQSEPAAVRAASRKAVYLDYAATTPVDPRVAQKMSACLLVEGTFGNPASKSHVFGWEAEEAVEHARTQVAAVLQADPREIVWTSGATEADNLALKGVADGADKRHIITSAVEHKAVLDTCEYLSGKGFSITYLKPGTDGIVRPEQVAEALTDETLIVSIMHANNETGVINDVAAIGAVCRQSGVLMHTDAAQSFGKLPLDVQTMALDMISISGHKIYGPKGIGALYVRREPPVHLTPLIHGGGHERGMRSGTLATHQIVGLGEAAAIMMREREREHDRLLALRQRLWSHLKQIPGAVLNGSEEARLPGLINVGFKGVDGETLLMALDDVAVSSGSACTSASVEASYVLRALGVDDALAHASLRFTVGRFTTESEVDFAGRRVAEVVGRLKGLN